MAHDSRTRAWLAALLLCVAAGDARALESRNVRLLGTIVSSDPASSQAVVEVGGKQSVVRAGMDVGGAEVVEIQSDLVLLRRAGQLEKLTLGSISVASLGKSGNVPASPGPASADSDAPPPTPANAPASALVARRSGSASNSAALRRGVTRGGKMSEGEAARTTDQVMADLAAQARFAPVMDNDGKLRGVAVMNIMSDSLIERLGLRSDDVIVAIQGTPIDSSGRAMNVARSLNLSQPVRLDIERNGSPTSLTVNPGAIYHR
jgi:type II secretion system protein C